jgi:hypothetical protein
VEVDMRLSMCAFVGLLFLTGCGSGRVMVAQDDPAPRASQPAQASQPLAAAPAARPAMQGPVAVLGISPGQYPPLGGCRVWMPGAPAAQQPPPCSCFSLMLDVPAGAWVLYRPTSDESVVQVTTYDASKPNTIVAIDVYDAESGKYLRSTKR